MYCQLKLRGLTSGLGMRPPPPMRTPVVAAAVPAKRRKVAARKTAVSEVPSSASADEVEEEEEEEEEEEPQQQVDEREQVEGAHADEPDWLRQLRSNLGDARDSTGTVLDVLANRDEEGNLSFSIAAVEPSARMASADEGGLLAANASRLRELLRNDDYLHGARLDTLGRLSHWWVIATRAYAFHGLFQHLAKRKRGRPKKQPKKERASIE